MTVVTVVTVVTKKFCNFFVKKNSTQIVTQLKNSNCDKTQEQKL